MKIQKIGEASWRDILAIQDESYKEIGSESLEVLQDKWHISPDTCFVCISDEGNVAGYLLSHPWFRSEPPKLFEQLASSEEQAIEYLYLHDIAIHPEFRGRAVGHSMVKALFNVATQKNFRKVSLVAVQGSASFWLLQGFHERPNVRVGSEYGNGAVFMEKQL